MTNLSHKPPPILFHCGRLIITLWAPRLISGHESVLLIGTNTLHFTKSVPRPIRLMTILLGMRYSSYIIQVVRLQKDGQSRRSHRLL